MSDTSSLTSVSSMVRLLSSSYSFVQVTFIIVVR